MPSRRVLITGGSGFVGQWMCRHLLAQGCTVFAGTLDGAVAPGALLPEQRAAVHWLDLDMASDEAITRALDAAVPQWVVHLAAVAFPQDATAAPALAFEINALGALRLLNRLVASGAADVRVLVVGSAEQYGVPATGEPIVETAPQRPVSVYGASKAAQELIALQMARTAPVGIVCARSFNHAGTGQGPQYLVPALVARGREVPRSGGVMRLGNSAIVRDYLHVVDVVSAYVALLELGTSGEAYNVSSGRGIAVRDIADRVLKRLGVHAEISTDPALTRPSDVPVLVGDNAKLRSATGWAPRCSVDDIIDDVIHGTTR